MVGGAEVDDIATRMILCVAIHMSHVAVWSPRDRVANFVLRGPDDAVPLLAVRGVTMPDGLFAVDGDADAGDGDGDGDNTGGAAGGGASGVTTTTAFHWSNSVWERLIADGRESVLSDSDEAYRTVLAWQAHLVVAMTATCQIRIGPFTTHR